MFIVISKIALLFDLLLVIIDVLHFHAVFNTILLHYVLRKSVIGIDKCCCRSRELFIVRGCKVVTTAAWDPSEHGGTRSTRTLFVTWGSLNRMQQALLTNASDA